MDYFENLSEDNKQLCKQLRDRVTDLHITEEFRVIDYNMMRFLKAREMNLDKAEEMFRKYIAWRRENDVDNSLTWKIASDLKENLKYQITGLSLDGGLVACANAGRWDPSLASGRYEEYMKLAFHELENLTQFNKHLTLRSNRFSKVVGIVNLEGLTFAHVSTVDWIRAMISLLKAFEAFYPETLKVAFLLNAPWAFSLLWSIARPFISTETHKRLKFLGSGRDLWNSEITKFVAEDQFPACFGGTLPDDFKLVFQDGKIHQVGKENIENDKNENKRSSPLPNFIESLD